MACGPLFLREEQIVRALPRKKMAWIWLGRHSSNWQALSSALGPVLEGLRDQSAIEKLETFGRTGYGPKPIAAAAPLDERMQQLPQGLL